MTAETAMYAAWAGAGVFYIFSAVLYFRLGIRASFQAVRYGRKHMAGSEGRVREKDFYITERCLIENREEDP